MKKNVDKGGINVVRVEISVAKRGHNTKRIRLAGEKRNLRLEPTSGLEPLTCRLRIGCSTN